MEQDSKTPDTEKKLFGKWNDLALLLIGFTLTTIIGSIITFRAQKTNSVNDHNRLLRETEKNESQKVFENLSDLMDKRIFKMRKIIWAYSQSPATDSLTIESKWNNYRQLLDDWNEHLNKNLALLTRYFKEEDRKCFEDTIHLSLRNAGAQLETYKKSKKVENLKNAMAEVDFANDKIYWFDLKLLNEIKNNDAEYTKD